MATFSFMAPSIAGARGQLQFNVGALNFRSKELRSVAMAGTHAQYAGSGTINGAGDHQFSMTATAGAATGEGAPGSFSLKIWHTDPATGAQVVDYDSRGAGTSATDRQFFKGMIASH